jgi:L-arabinose transport system permease protein
MQGKQPRGIRVLTIGALANLWANAGMVVVFFALFLGVSIFVPQFFTPFNMKALAVSVATVGMVACTMLFCLASGHFDLSVETILSMSGVLAALVVASTGSVLLGVVAGIAAGGIVGAVNGVVIARFKINALITTLATMQIVKGMGYLICRGEAVTVGNEGFFVLGNSAVLGVPTPVWITTFCFVVFGILLNKTVFGRQTLAIGGNKESARLAGINVFRTQFSIFLMQGFVAGFAGVIVASKMTSGQPKPPEGFALDVISACVLGGVSLSGGVGSMTGTVVGVLIMGTVANALNLLNVDTYYQYVVRGAILLAAVLFDQYGQSRKRKRIGHVG